MSIGAAYPVRVDATLDPRLSRWLWLVKWLLAIPHYVVVGIFAGGVWLAWEADRNASAGGGLIGLLVLVAAVVLAVTGRYPQPIYDFVLGLNRWVLRVAAYAALMTDEYPPFRLDMGGHEPAATMTVPPPAATPPPAPSGGRGWTGGRVVAVVIGSLLGLLSFGLLAAGGVATWATNTQRDAAGYLTSGTRSFATPSYAVTSDAIDLGGSADWVTAGDFLGRVRLRVSSLDPARGVFVGVGPRAAVETYLAGVDRLVVTNWASGETRSEAGTGVAPATAPAHAGIWTAQASGRGTQTLSWRPTSGQWVVVVMNQDASRGVAVSASAGASIPDLGSIAAGLLAAGAVLLLAAALLIAVPVTRASR